MNIKRNLLFALLSTGLMCLPFQKVAQAAPVFTVCTPDEVAVFTTAARIHVRCVALVNGVKYFAAATTDKEQAARVLDVMRHALSGGKTLTINYDPADLSGAAIGCQTSNCRLIREIAVGK